MHHPIGRRKLLHAGLAAGASLLVPAAHGCEFFSTTMRIVHPWARASAADASTAVVCMTFADVRQADRLIGVQTPVAARAELGGGAVDFFIPKDRESALTETGVVLQLVDLAHALEVGREYPMQLVFENGGNVNAKLSIDYARFR